MQCCKNLPDKKEKVRWYFRPYWLIIAFLCLGPLMLPLLWLSPCLSPRKKIIITVLIFIVSYYLTIFVKNSLNIIGDYYNLLQEVI
jgi:hypothetical protein